MFISQAITPHYYKMSNMCFHWLYNLVRDRFVLQPGGNLKNWLHCETLDIWSRSLRKDEECSNTALLSCENKGSDVGRIHWSGEFLISSPGIVVVLRRTALGNWLISWFWKSSLRSYSLPRWMKTLFWVFQKWFGVKILHIISIASI